MNSPRKQNSGLRSLMPTSVLKHISPGVRVSLGIALSPQEPRLATIKRQKLAWFGQPLQNNPSGHLGGLAKPWLAQKMLGGQHQRVDIRTHARTAQKGLP